MTPHDLRQRKTYFCTANCLSCGATAVEVNGHVHADSLILTAAWCRECFDIIPKRPWLFGKGLHIDTIRAIIASIHRKGELIAERFGFEGCCGCYGAWREADGKRAWNPDSPQLIPLSEQKP